jgi:hypothetical protein
MDTPGSYIETGLHWAISFATSLVVFVLLVNLFRSRPPAKLIDRPSSFLEIEALVSERTLRMITWLAAFPMSALVFLLALEAAPFVEQAKVFLISCAADLLNERWQQGMTEFLRQMPSYLSPLFVLGVSLVTFAPYVRVPFEFVRSLILTSMGIEARADRGGRDAAKLVLQKLGSRRAELRLEEKFGDAPLPLELIHADDETQLAYQILFFSADNTRLNGLRIGLARTLAKVGIDAAVTIEQIIYPSRVAAALVIYLALCMGYVLIAPLAAPWVQTHTIGAGFFAVEWPLPQFRGILALTVSQQTFAFIVPFALGMWLYSARRRQCNGETALQTLAVVFGAQFLFSGFVNFVFDALFIAQRSIGELSHDLISFKDPKIWADILVPAIAPSMALVSWIWTRDLHFRWLGYALLGLAAALVLNVCQLTYECVSGEIRGYFWHQSVLGLFLMLSFVLSASVVRNATLIRQAEDRTPIALVA